MNDAAVLVSQSGRLTPGLSVLVGAWADGPISTLVSDRSVHGRYYLSPPTVREVEQHVAAAADTPSVVVDGEPHPGQLVDLQARLPSITVVDRRRVAWERLAGNNPVAAIRLSLQEAHLARRRAANAQRDAATADPSGTSGTVADCDRRIQTLGNRLEREQAAARRRVRCSHTTVDGYVVLLGPIGAPTTELWSELVGRKATTEVGLPARPTTAQTAVGPHTVAVTDVPEILGGGGIPQWLEDVVPGLVTALERATCVLGAGEDHAALVQSAGDRFEIPYRSLARADATSARAALDDILPTVTCAVRLPYSDDTQALVSELHDRTVVEETAYDDAIYVRIKVARTATDELRRRVAAIGGELKQLDPSGDVEGTGSSS